MQSSIFLRHQVRLPPLFSSLRHALLFSFPLRRLHLQMHFPTFRLGTIRSMIYKEDAPVGSSPVRALWFPSSPNFDDFLLAASPPGRAATSADAARARVTLTRLFRLFGIARNKTKGRWQRWQQISPLGMYVDSDQMRLFFSSE